LKPTAANKHSFQNGLGKCLKLARKDQGLTQAMAIVVIFTYAAKPKSAARRWMNTRSKGVKQGHHTRFWVEGWNQLLKTMGRKDHVQLPFLKKLKI